MTAPPGGTAVPTGEGAPALSHWEGEPVPVWRALWGVPALEVFASLASTNDRARQLAGEGAPPFTVVMAEEQTRGRGREGRCWHSPPGAGLWMSILAGPAEGPTPPLTPLLAGLAVVRAVEDVAPGVDPGLKWPNDVLVGERKLAGILCEALAGGPVVVGVGVNVRPLGHDAPPDVRARAVSLDQALGAQVARSALAGRIVCHVRRLLARPPLRLDPETAAALDRVDALRDRRVRTSDGVEGRAAGIAPDGALRVETDDGGTVAVYGGSVRGVEDGEEGRQSAGGTNRTGALT